MQCQVDIGFVYGFEGLEAQGDRSAYPGRKTAPSMPWIPRFAAIRVVIWGGNAKTPESAQFDDLTLPIIKVIVTHTTSDRRRA